MRYWLFLIIVCYGGCVNNTNIASPLPTSEDSLTFIWIKKDSTAIRRYSLDHQYMIYHSSRPGESFSLLYDSMPHQWLFRDKYDSSILFLEKEEVFTLNGAHHTISKLISGKGTADGEMTYIVDRTAGLLALKSNTWRYAMYRKTDDLQLSALILRIVTEEEFYLNHKDTAGAKFTTPRMNY